MRRAALLAGLALAACTQQATGRGPAGEQPTIVSLNPCSDAVLAEVADPEQILALSHYSLDPVSSSMDVELARRFPAVSGSVEEIAALDPDVVVAGTFLPPATRAALADLGVAVVTMPIASSVKESREQVVELARLVGHEERGILLRARIDVALAHAAAPVSRAPIPALVWQAGGIVPGGETLIADLLTRTGFASFSAGRGMAQAEYMPLEQVLADPPRVILAAGDPLRSEDRLLHHPALGGLEGVSRARLDPSLLWCGGPTLIRAAERLAHIRKTLGMTYTDMRGLQ